MRVEFAHFRIINVKVSRTLLNKFPPLIARGVEVTQAYFGKHNSGAKPVNLWMITYCGVNATGVNDAGINVAG